MDIIRGNIYCRFWGTAATPPYNARNASAILFKYKKLNILLDCGEHATKTLLRYRESLNIDMIFITHIHGDHIYGLFGLIDTFNKNNRTRPLYIS